MTESTTPTEPFAPPTDVVDRFWARVNKTETCWLWTGGATSEGYGDLMYQRHRHLAHRFAWQLANARAIPVGLVVRHRCDNPPCVRPDHLELGSVAQNVRDAYERRRRTTGNPTLGTGRPNALLTDELVATLRRRARSGQSITSIAKGTGFSYATVYRAIRGSGWPHVSEPPVLGRRREKPHWNHFVRNNPGAVTEARALRDQGLSLQEIADRLGITKTAAFRCCRTHMKEAS
jgi:hypothetical protein